MYIGLGQRPSVKSRWQYRLNSTDQTTADALLECIQLSENRRRCSCRLLTNPSLSSNGIPDSLKCNETFKMSPGQLNQCHLAICCDEDVYCITWDIQLLNPSKFCDIGSLFRNIPFIEDIPWMYWEVCEWQSQCCWNRLVFKENCIFGPKTTEAVLSGPHLCSVFGMIHLICYLKLWKDSNGSHSLIKMT